ncbi:MAG: hypothetical protein ACLRFK_03480 [Alphaproteobacteria bacterium]
MRVKTHIFCTFIAIMAFILPSYSASIFSKYGVIQNVQDYSTNPSWNPNSPYNMHLPRPVYAFGPQVGTDDCLQIVSDLVAITCSGMNNCVNAELSDVRPSVMLQLSRITTGNYATSCGGYIDGAFYDYIAQNGHNIQGGNIVAFPTPNINTIQPIQIQNPFTPQLPDWAIEFQERKQELQDLQSQNGTNVYGVESIPFPTTYADLSFTERMKNEKQGYEPYKDKHAYERVKINMPKTVTSAKQCQITYELDPKRMLGGHVGNSLQNPPSFDTTNQDRYVNLYPPVPNDDIKNEYEFKGWFDDQNYAGAQRHRIYSNDCTNNKITIYAKWGRKVADDKDTPPQTHNKVNFSHTPVLKSDVNNNANNGGNGGGNGGGGGANEDFTGGYAILYSNEKNLQPGTIYSEANPSWDANCSSPSNYGTDLSKVIKTRHSIQDLTETNFFFDPKESTRVFPGLLIGSTSTPSSEPNLTYTEKIIMSIDLENTKKDADQLALDLKSSACAPGYLYVVQLHKDTLMAATTTIPPIYFEGERITDWHQAVYEVEAQFPDSHHPVKIVSEAYDI